MFKVTSTRNRPSKNICSGIYHDIPERADIGKCNMDANDYRNKINTNEIQRYEMEIEKTCNMYQNNNSRINHSDAILIYESNEYMKRLGRRDRFRRWKWLMRTRSNFGRNEINAAHIFNQDVPDFFERRTILIAQLSLRLHLYSDILADIYKNLKKIHVCQDALRFFTELGFNTLVDQCYDITYVIDISDIYRRLTLGMINGKNKDRSCKLSSFHH